MNSKKRIIPNVPKEERVDFDIGHHKTPNWLLVLFGIIALVWIVIYIYRP